MIENTRLNDAFGAGPSMRGNTARDKAPLRFRQIESGENKHYSRFAELAETVFDMAPEPAWPVITFQDDTDRCVAGLQHSLLRLLCDDVPFSVAAIRNVAVAPDWRGQGLMHDLLVRTLALYDARATVTLLYAETPALYARLGFASLPQHAFEAAAPSPEGEASACPVDSHANQASVRRCLATREPASSCCGVIEDGGMAEHALQEGTWLLAYDPALAALIVYENDAETLVLVDVIAERMPSAARILGALGARPGRLRTLFPPDKLAWDGVPVPEDAGLMARGALPQAMLRPFILPPTFEF